jgi:hypothetical protein
MITVGNIVSIHAHAVQPRVITQFVTEYQAIPLLRVQPIRNGADNSGLISILMKDGCYFLHISNIFDGTFN